MDAAFKIIGELHGRAAIAMRLRIIKLTILVFLAMLQLSASGHFATLGAQGKSVLKGVVRDVTDAWVPGTTVIITGETDSYKVIANDEGEYEIALPEGVYRLTVSEFKGFTSYFRSAFRIPRGSTTTLDVTLFSSPPLLMPYPGTKPNEVFDDTAFGEFEYESLALPDSPKSPLKLMIRFGTRRRIKGSITYEATANPREQSSFGEPFDGVMISYDLLTVHAKKVILHKNPFRLEAQGNVIIEKDGQLVHARLAQITFKAGTPAIRFLKDSSSRFTKFKY